MNNNPQWWVAHDCGFRLDAQRTRRMLLGDGGTGTPKIDTGGIVHIVIWIAAGSLAGFAIGRALRGPGYGLVGSVFVGIAGGIVGGWLSRHVLAVATDEWSGVNLLAGLGGGAALVLVVRILDRSIAKPSQSNGETSSSESDKSVLGELERRVIARFAEKKPVAVNPDAVLSARRTFGGRVAETVDA